RAEREQAARHDGGAHQQYQRQRDFADDEQSTGAEANRAFVATAFFQRFVEIRSASAERGNATRQDAGDQRTTDREQQHAGVNRDFIRARHLIRQQPGAKRQAGLGNQQAGRATAEG